MCPERHTITKKKIYMYEYEARVVNITFAREFRRENQRRSLFPHVARCVKDVCSRKKCTSA